MGPFNSHELYYFLTILIHHVQIPENEWASSISEKVKLLDKIPPTSTHICIDIRKHGSRP